MAMLCDQQLKTSSKSSISKPAPNHAVDPQYDEKKTDPIKIVVFGASGGGKSTLCNLLYNRDEFKCGNGFTSCTIQPQSAEFEYKIEDKAVKFEIMDCPGFFDTDDIITKMEEDDLFKRMIENVCQFADHPISGYLLVIPFGRMDLNHARSLQFITQCFNMDAIDHLMIIFTKSGNRSMDEIKGRISISAETTETGKFLQKCVECISSERCFATECIAQNKIHSNAKQRCDILTTIFSIHNDRGPLTDTAMWNAFQRQKQRIEQEQEERKQALQRAEDAEAKWTRTLYLFGGVMSVVSIAGGLTYNKLQNAVATINVITADKNQLQKTLKILSTQMAEMMRDKQMSEAAVKDLQKQMDLLAQQVQKAKLAPVKIRELQKQIAAASKQLTKAINDKGLLLQMIGTLEKKLEEQSKSCVIL